MWYQNAFTDRLNLKWPILQAPMGWFSTPALAAAVSNAGGLGGLGMWGYSAEEAERRIAGFHQMLRNGAAKAAPAGFPQRDVRRLPIPAGSRPYFCTSGHSLSDRGRNAWSPGVVLINL